MTATELARTEYVLLRMAAAGVLSWRDHVLHMYDQPITPASNADVVASLTHRRLLDEHVEGSVTRIRITEKGEWALAQEFELDVACSGVSSWTVATVLVAGASGWAGLLWALWWVLRSWS